MKPSTRRRIKRRSFLFRRKLKVLRRLKRLRTAPVPSKRRKFSAMAPGDEWHLHVPKNILILGRPGHTTMTNFLAELRQAFAHKTRAICVDFTATAKLFPEGLLLFYAELDRLVSVFQEKRVRCIPAANATVDGVLQHLGIYKLLNHESPTPPTGDNVVGWKVHHAQQVDGNIFGPPIETLGLKTELAAQLFKGVSEAVTNVRHHAHLAQRKDGLKLPARQEWWMFIHESDSKLYVAVCDLGIGIPRSLPIQHGWPAVSHALHVMFGQQKRTDGRLIKAALRLGRTRTDSEHRGMGFTDMIAVLSTMPESRMVIYSNHGALTYNGSVQPPALETHTFKNSVLGTIVVWHFPNEGTSREN